MIKTTVTAIASLALITGVAFAHGDDHADDIAGCQEFVDANGLKTDCACLYDTSTDVNEADFAKMAAGEQGENNENIDATTLTLIESCTEADAE